MLTQFRIDAKDVTKEPLPIGHGSSGQIYKGLYNKKQIVIKELDDKEWEDSFVTEIKMLQEISSFKTSSPYIVKFYGYINSKNYAFILEYLPKGDLINYVNDYENAPMSERRRISLEVAYGLQYLHGHKIIHRDIKPENVVLGEDGRARIIDFGLAVFSHGDKEFTKDLVGTPRYLAPELLTGAKLTPYSYKSDMYAYAILLYVLYTMDEPYPDTDDNFEICKRVRSGKIPVIPSTCLEKDADLIRACWERKPEQRLSATAVVNILERASLVSNKQSFWERRIKNDKEVKTQEYKEKASLAYYKGNK